MVLKFTRRDKGLIFSHLKTECFHILKSKRLMCECDRTCVCTHIDARIPVYAHTHTHIFLPFRLHVYSRSHECFLMAWVYFNSCEN